MPWTYPYVLSDYHVVTDSDPTMTERPPLIRLVGVSSSVGFLDKQLEELRHAWGSMVETLSASMRLPQLTALDPILREISRSYRTQMADLAASIANSMVPITGWQASLTELVDAIGRTYDPITQRIAVDMAAAFATLRETSFSGIFRTLDGVVQEFHDLPAAFKAAGWPLAPSMPRALRQRVLTLYREGKVRYASSAIMGYYQRDSHRHLVDAVTSWNDQPLFAPRMHIIRDALLLHCERRYTSSVPTVMPQIEGILSDFVVTNRLAARVGSIRQVYQAVLAKDDSLSVFTWLIVDTLRYQLETSTYAFTDFSNELRRSVERRRATRHTILHGIALNYDRPVHSLRAFLLLDALSALQPPDPQPEACLPGQMPTAQ